MTLTAEEWLQIAESAIRFRLGHVGWVVEVRHPQGERWGVFSVQESGELAEQQVERLQNLYGQALEAGFKRGRCAIENVPKEIPTYSVFLLISTGSDCGFRQCAALFKSGFLSREDAKSYLQTRREKGLFYIMEEVWLGDDNDA